MKSRSYFTFLLAVPLLALPLLSCNSSLVGACSAGQDTDGDGLQNDVECGLGTDPSVADSDGDGISDGDEVANGTDPTRNEALAPKIPGCVGECVVNYNCPAAQGPTTLSGTVYIPSGMLPLYNAKVYIPTGDAIEPPPASGASCDRCDTMPQGFSTTTDINGKFTLPNVPHGQNIR